MKVSTASMHLRLLCAMMPRYTRKCSRSAAHMLSWQGRLVHGRSQAAIQRALGTAQQWSERCTTRIEELQRKIHADAYSVDSESLARCILVNETHFLQNRQP